MVIVVGLGRHFRRLVAAVAAAVAVARFRVLLDICWEFAWPPDCIKTLIERGFGDRPLSHWPQFLSERKRERERERETEREKEIERESGSGGEDGRMGS